MSSDVPNSENGVRAAGRGTAWVVLGTMCVLVIGFYAGSAKVWQWDLRISSAEDCYYNLLVRGFRAGQLNLKRDVPPGLAKLADRYDRTAHLDGSGGREASGGGSELLSRQIISLFWGSVFHFQKRSVWVIPR